MTDNDLPRANRPAHSPRMDWRDRIPSIPALVRENRLTPAERGALTEPIELGTFEDYRRWATALTEDGLPEILSGLVNRGQHLTTIDAEELTRRMTWVTALKQAADKAYRALENVEGLLAYEDVQPTDLFKDEQGQIR